MKIELLDGEFSVCKLNNFDPTDFDRNLFFACKSDKEYSLVCKSDDAPERCLQKEDGFAAARIDGTLEFSLTGILAEITSLLADMSIPVFAISTFDTDYFLIKKRYLTKALEALKAFGYEIK